MKKWILCWLALWPAFAMAQPVGTAAFVESYAREHAFSGTVLVERSGRVEYEQSFDMADRAFAVPNTPDTRYWIASITKLFTATLAMQLVDEGRIELDAPIRTCLPDYAGEGRDVTVRQLLTHTSGIANFDTVTDAATALRDGIPAYQLPHTSDDLLRRHASGKLVHVPGTTFDYNNGDYVILGKIIERVTGMPFEQTLSRRILEPLKLTDTGMLRQGEILPRLARTYFVREDTAQLVNDLPVYPENWYAAGGMYSTVRDLRLFADALYGGGLIRRESLQLMLTPGLDDYGFGVWSYESTIAGKPHRVAKRPGRIMGAQAQLYRLLDDDVTVVILANVGNVDLDEFVARIGRVVVSGKPER